METAPPAAEKTGSRTGLMIGLGVAAIGIAAVLYFNWRWSKPAPAPPPLTQDARAYVRGGFLQLSEVDMKAKENFAQQTLVEVTGKITNAGNRVVRLVEINCVFYDPYRQVVLRDRQAIVSARSGGLQPGETKAFRLAFDTIPQSWNQTLPDLVIARIDFN